jgi:LPS export ABC transporter protein LptC
MAITMDAREAARGPVLKGARDAAERARAFRRARRHSLLVKMLRVALPVAAAGIAGFYALTLGVSWQMGPGRLKIGEMEVTADDLTMKDATYFGLTKDGGRYEVRAKKAIVEFNKEAPIKLIDIDGDLLQANNVATKLKAKHGLLDNAKSELELFDNIEIDASNGMKARMQQAMVYSKDNRVISKLPVQVFAPTGQIRGATMTLNTKTRQATFIGDVAVRLVQSGEQPGQKAGQKSGQSVPTTSAFGRDSRQPVDVTSEQFHLDEEAHTALFTGNVLAVQGDSTLKSPVLTVSYEGKGAADLAAAPAGQAGEGSQLTRLVAKSGVVVTAGPDRRVTSDEADFDAKADTALFSLPSRLLHLSV